MDIRKRGFIELLVKCYGNENSALMRAHISRAMYEKWKRNDSYFEGFVKFVQDSIRAKLN